MTTVYNVGVKIQPMIPGAATIKLLMRRNWIDGEVNAARVMDDTRDSITSRIQNSLPLHGYLPQDTAVQVAVGPDILKNSLFETTIIAAEQ